MTLIQRFGIVRYIMPAGAMVLVALGSSACSSGSKVAVKHYDTVATMSGLRYIDYVVGNGPVVQPGQTVVVDYAGYLENGILFDTSLDSVGHAYDKEGRIFLPTATSEERANFFDRGGYPFEPLTVTNLGAPGLIAGWTEALTTNMRVGGARRIIVPANLAYGPAANGKIPPNSVLIFDMHLREARSGGVESKPRR